MLYAAIDIHKRRFQAAVLDPFMTSKVRAHAWSCAIGDHQPSVVGLCCWCQTARVAETAPRLSDGVLVLDAFTVRDVAAQLAGEDEEHARRFGSV